MGKKRIFSLDPDQLERLLSIGTGAEDPVKDQEQRRQNNDSHAPSQKEPPPKKKGQTQNAGASISIVFEQPGDRIGPYKLLRILGEGGMGIAYLAEQAQPIKRRVALKVIKPGMDSRRVIARFEAERQALALLDHPNIAHIHDAGTTNTGRPYFAMEYVEGLPITEHCDGHKLTIEERLKLFLQVCYAVHHAHQKGIIHRDLKPSNILVSFADDHAVPKIIDFGVAKATSEPLTDRTLFTEQGQLFGTPEYMSPEQADMAIEDIDTRSDIYSLGVLLYVLLTGVLPFDSSSFRKGGIERIRQVIRETDPKTPSTRLSSLGEQAKKIAENRRSEIRALAKHLHRELEWIPLKAMRKERAERYRSASELADDIENYLGGNPLIAGPLTAGYRLKKFVRRNRALVAGVAAILVVLFAGIIVSTLFAVGQARALAESRAVSDFLQNSVFRLLDPLRAGRTNITSRSVWDAASEDLEGGKFNGMPLAEEKIQFAVASGYWSLGVYDRAQYHMQRALDLCLAHLGPDDPNTVIRMKNVGWGYFFQSRFKKAEQFLSKAFAGRQRLPFDHFERWDIMRALGTVYFVQGRFEEGAQLCCEALDTYGRMEGEEREVMVIFLAPLAWGRTLQGHYDEAAGLFERGLDIARRKSDPNNWYVLDLKKNFGELCRLMGRYDEAKTFLDEAFMGRRDGWGPEHPDTVSAMANLSRLYVSQGRYKEAEDLLRRTGEIARRVLGDTHLTTTECVHGLGTVYLSQGRHDDAEPLLNEALEIANDLFGEKNWYVLRVMNTLARLRTKQKQYAEAMRLFEEALGGRKHKLGDNHPDTLETMHDLAVLYKEQAHYEEAEKLLLEALEGRRLKLGDTHPHTQQSLSNLIALYDAWNKQEQADEWRAELQQTKTVEE